MSTLLARSKDPEADRLRILQVAEVLAPEELPQGELLYLADLPLEQMAAQLILANPEQVRLLEAFQSVEHMDQEELAEEFPNLESILQRMMRGGGMD